MTARLLPLPLLLLLLLLLLVACAPYAETPAADAPTPAVEPGEVEPGEVDHACKVDSDCAVKNVGNCCGYYPACVNRDSPTFPERVMARCAEEEMAGICGFPDIAGCACVAGRCENVLATPLIEGQEH
ncbi:MAG: hypothetical protein ACK4RW_09425 [Rehaibacterium terrae]|uniref:hypothetical protein n=1 Tax=Rehaibacterium terrae TaxID=1341696 RepID=UPI00391A6E22